MKKFVSSSAFIKFTLLALFALISFSGCQTARLSSVENAPAALPTPTISPKVDNAINRPTSEPYTGDLSIFDAAERAKNLQIDRVMDILKITEGKSVADIGAGSGWFTTRAAKRVGERGKVFAVEINREYIDYIDNRAKKENFSNIQTVMGTEDNPKVPENSVDAVLILKTYHEIGQPVKVLLNLKKSLKKGALVGVIDRNGKGDDHGIDMDKVVEEFRRAGFVKVDDYDFVKPDGMDYFLVFQPK
ncbi:MAG: methyltransferase domain-containing protein [Acidobacteriota bacterium]|nr:methyltransferase domain-containing protein [Acidobacteriota bacterium]